jgi:hypothetical protein
MNTMKTVFLMTLMMLLLLFIGEAFGGRARTDTGVCLFAAHELRDVLVLR